MADCSSSALTARLLAAAAQPALNLRRMHAARCASIVPAVCGPAGMDTLPSTALLAAGAIEDCIEPTVPCALQPVRPSVQVGGLQRICEYGVPSDSQLSDSSVRLSIVCSLTTRALQQQGAGMAIAMGDLEDVISAPQLSHEQHQAHYAHDSISTMHVKRQSMALKPQVCRRPHSPRLSPAAVAAVVAAVAVAVGGSAGGRAQVIGRGLLVADAAARVPVAHAHTAAGRARQLRVARPQHRPALPARRRRCTTLRKRGPSRHGLRHRGLQQAGTQFEQGIRRSLVAGSSSCTAVPAAPRCICPCSSTCAPRKLTKLAHCVLQGM
jgi:hypothetical protein